jgi:hypothetical protein
MSRQDEIRGKRCVRARYSLRWNEAEPPKNAKRILVAGLECGDPEARRAGEMTAGGGAKGSPKNAKRILVAGLECGDLDARRAGEMTAWGGAKMFSLFQIVFS